MTLRMLPRTAVDGSLKVIHWPLGVAAGIVAGAGGKAAVERADASVRGIAGAVLGDEQLRDSARTRHAVAYERARARRLAAKARERMVSGEERAAQRAQAAEHTRARAVEQAERGREQAAHERAARERAVSEDEQRRRGEVKAAGAQAKRTRDEQSARERLGQLDEQAEALGKRAASMDTADRADRLGRKAGAAKAERKGR